MKRIVAFCICAAAVPFAACFAQDSAFGRSPSVTPREAEAIKAAAEATENGRALEILSEASGRKWAGSAIWFNLGNAQMRASDAESAVKSYRKALEILPSFFMAQKNLAFALSGLGRESDAFLEMRKTLALSGGSDVPTLLWLASRAAGMSDNSAALNFCNQALLYDENNRDALLAKAVFLYELGRFEECETVAKRLLSEGNLDARALRLLGKSRAHRGDYCAAVAAFKILEKSGSAENSDAAFMGDLLFREGLYSEAAERYAAAGREASIANAAYAMLNSGDFDGALAVSARLSGHERCKIEGLSKAGSGDLGGAKKSLEKYLAAVPGDAYAACKLAGVCIELGDFPKAEALYYCAAADPRFERLALYGMMRASLSSGDCVGALARARAIEKKYPSAEISEYVKSLKSYVSGLD